MVKEVWVSIKEWWAKVPQRWWDMLSVPLTFVPLLAGVVAFSIWARVISPPLPWWNIALVLGGSLLFFWASFSAFHRVRLERDGARAALQAKLSTRKERRVIAERLAEFHMLGDELLMAVTNGSEKEPLALFQKWGNDVKQYFYSNPHELGKSGMLSILPNNRELTVPLSSGFSDEAGYVLIHLTIQLDKIKKLAEDFSR